ncbi:MAG: PIN domain-containing protein [Clostridiales Family XIII bacterium]|jgi:predicted nucleic-acid-binding protein|nr:PIN domain-containing protein [Clostridiales Family XIII bacterium]
MRIIDANVVLRYLLNDHEEYSPKARQIIENETVEVPIEVLCEVVFVLSGVYKIDRNKIGTKLRTFFETTKCDLPHRVAVLKGLELFSDNNLDFVDCILAGYKRIEEVEIHTFDKKLLRLLNQ